MCIFELDDDIFINISEIKKDISKTRPENFVYEEIFLMFNGEEWIEIPRIVYSRLCKNIYNY